MSNVDKVTDFLLNNVTKLKSDKIQALASVIQALGGDQPQMEKEPNSVKEQKDEFIDDTHPIEDIAEIQGIQIEGMPAKPVKIYSS